MKRWTGEEGGATTPPVQGISHEEMASILGITVEEWLSPVEMPVDDDDTDEWTQLGESDEPWIA